VVPQLRLEPTDLAAVPKVAEQAPGLAAFNALAANVLVWGYSKYLARADWADITLETMRGNLRGPWEYDPDAFLTNQFGHPYQGSLSFTSARAAGLGFWWSVPYPIVMSTLWELFGENENPSINDTITTPVAGTFLGEVLFRMSSMILDGGGATPGVWRELGAAAVSPMVGLTRLERGDRYRVRQLELIPVHFEVAATGSFSGQAIFEGDTQTTSGLIGFSTRVTHGLPVPGWSLRKPFDHFDFAGGMEIASTPLFNLAVRGLMLGRSFGEAEGTMGRGFWGLWGIYEAFSPGVFRTSTSALGLGAVRQWAWRSGMAISLTGIGAAGFGAAGADRVTTDARNYHFGMNTLILVDARLYAADRGLVSAAFRQYYIGGLVSNDSEGSEFISRLDVGTRLRVYGPHAVGLDVAAGFRFATFADEPDASARFSKVVASYVYTPGATLGSGLRPAD